MPTHINGRPVKTGQWTDAEDALLAEWQAKLGNRCALTASSERGSASLWQFRLGARARPGCFRWATSDAAPVLGVYGRKRFSSARAWILETHAKNDRSARGMQVVSGGEDGDRAALEPGTPCQT